MDGHRLTPPPSKKQKQKKQTTPALETLDGSLGTGPRRQTILCTGSLFNTKKKVQGGHGTMAARPRSQGRPGGCRFKSCWPHSRACHCQFVGTLNLVGNKLQARHTERFPQFWQCAESGALVFGGALFWWLEKGEPAGVPYSKKRRSKRHIQRGSHSKGIFFDPSRHA